jgi:hypothetical protein
MANEGIMALPQGAGMQDDQASEMPAVTSFDAYDAAQTALKMARPEEQDMLRQALRENMQELELTPSELEQLIEVFEQLSQRPDRYKQMREQLIREDIVDAEDIPEEYDPEFLGAVLSVLNELKMTSIQGAQAPMMEESPMEGMGAMPMAQGGLADVASYLASQGRRGDTMLAHITPEEAQLLQSRGGAGTINPNTGLPEFFVKKVAKAFKNTVKRVVDVTKKIVKSPVGRILMTVALATVLGPAGIGLASTTAGAAALGSAGATLLGGGNLKDALISGAMGYIGGGGTIMGTNPMAAVGKYLPGVTGSALNTGLATGVIGAGLGKLGGMSTQDALRMGLMSGASAAALAGVRNNTTLMDGRVTPEDLRQRAQEGFRSGEIAAQNAAQPSAPGPIGTAADLMSPVESLNYGGTAQAARFMPFEPQGQGISPQRLAYDAAQQGDIGRVADLQQKFPDRIVGRYEYDAGGGARSYSMATRDPVSKFTQRPLEFNPAAGPGVAPAGAAPAAPGATAPFPSASQSALDQIYGGPAPGAATPGAVAPGAGEPGFFDRMAQGAKDFYSENISPSRPGLPSDVSFIRQYGPLAATGLAVAGAAGGFKSKPADQNPAFNRDYTGIDYMRDNPSMFTGGLDSGYRPPMVRPPMVDIPTPGYAAAPMGAPGISAPGGFSRSPAGIPQPYNMAGLYGVPMLYGQPQRLAKGGQPKPTEFPRKTGPINGPGTGTSDSIPAMLSDGEFVFTARAVRNAGGGSRRKGAARMYKLMKKLEGGAVKA